MFLRKDKISSEKKLRVRIPYMGLSCLGIFFFCVIFANVISPHDPYEGDLADSTLPPVWEEGGTPRF